MSDGFSASTTPTADSPPPPISPRPTRPVSDSISTIVRTKRPQWQPLAWRSGASSGTVTVVARTSAILIRMAVAKLTSRDDRGPELLAQHQRHRAPQARLGTVARGDDSRQRCARPLRRARLDGRADDRPRARDFADDENEPGRESGDEHRDAPPEMRTHPVQR